VSLSFNRGEGELKGEKVRGEEWNCEEEEEGLELPETNNFHFGHFSPKEITVKQEVVWR
jgi:hypothetical protein